MDGLEWLQLAGQAVEQAHVKALAQAHRRPGLDPGPLAISRELSA
jgi:hypothetical protein